MTPNETEKIKLLQLFRQGKIDTLPDVDSDEYKAQKIRAMLDKEKSMEENYQMDGETYNRIDGLVDQSLLKLFLNTFKEINADLIKGGDEFDIDDIVDYLTIQLDKESRRSGTYLEEQDINDPTYVPPGIGKQAIKLDDAQHDQLMNQGSTLIKVDGKTYPLVWTGFDKTDEAGDYDTMEEETLNEVDGGVEFFKRIAFKK